MAKTIKEINEKIKKGKAVVVTAEEIIDIVDKKGVKRASENQCILASEIVDGYTRGMLEKDFVYESVNKLVREDGDFEEIEEQMKTKAVDWEKLDRFLRGYK